MTDRPALMALLLAGFVSVSGGTFAGCGPDAVGVDACRQIERARCEAGAVCGTVSDVAACQRFYRDQCLHGLAAAEAPGEPALRGCVEAIEAVASCEREESGVPIDECPGGAPATPLPGASLEFSCDIVLAPELVEECSFLAPEGSAGSTGSAENTGSSGAGGAGGSAG
jgi:hypothetical protein